MNFEKLREEINNLNIKSQEELKNIVDNIDISPENLDLWIDDIFSDEIGDLDFEKLPYVIEELYKSDDKFKFMLCCMLIESTCEYLPFIPNLEEYPLFKEKFKTLKHTLITVYERVDSGIANCMALIILNNDPEFKMFNDDEKDNIANNTVRKLTDIINYINNNEVIDDSVYRDLEIIIDLSIHLDDKRIDELIKELSKLNLNFECKLFIAKYKLVNNLDVNSNEIDELLKSEKNLYRVISIFENANVLNKISLDKITQEDIAKSQMIDWLMYPTELGNKPDNIELIDKLEYDGLIYYIYRFKSNSFRVKEYMLGVSGGYEKDKITSRNSGNTFSEFEEVKDNYKNQAIKLIEIINNHWKNREK